MRCFYNEEARKIIKDIFKKSDTQCAKRTTRYVKLRHHYEDIIRREFMKKVAICLIPHLIDT